MKDTRLDGCESGHPRQESISRSPLQDIVNDNVFRHSTDGVDTNTEQHKHCMNGIPTTSQTKSVNKTEHVSDTNTYLSTQSEDSYCVSQQSEYSLTESQIHYVSKKRALDKAQAFLLEMDMVAHSKRVRSEFSGSQDTQDWATQDDD